MAAVGCISVTANVAPKLCAQMQDASLAGRHQEALELHLKLMHLHRDLFCETSPAPTKYALSRLGKCSDEVRLPLVALSETGRATVDRALKAVFG